MEAAVVEAPRPRLQDGFLLCFTISTLLSCKLKKQLFILFIGSNYQFQNCELEFSECFDQLELLQVLFVYLLLFLGQKQSDMIIKFQDFHSFEIGCWIQWARYVNLLSFASVKCNLAHRFGRKGHGLPQGHQGGSGEPVDKRMTICNRDGGFGSSAEISAIPKPSGELNGGWALHPSSRRGHERCAGIAHWIIFSSEVTH